MEVQGLTSTLSGPLVLGLSALLVTTVLYKYFTEILFYWKKRGIYGPFPFPVTGSLIGTIFSNRLKLDTDRVKKYGKIYGLFRGTKPVLMISDPEVLIQICIKDFDCWQNHDVDNISNKYQKGFLFFLQGDHWKRIRALMSPTFTSGKMKRMYKLIDKCADDLSDNIIERLAISKDKKSTLVDLKEFFNLFTMDAIASCCYGIKLERSKAAQYDKTSPRNQFIKAADKIFNFNILRVLIFMCIPKNTRDWFGFKLNSENQFVDLVRIGQRLVDERRKMERPPDDYMQLILHAKLDDQIELGDLDDEENHHAGLTNDMLRRDQDNLVGDVKTRLSDAKATLTDQEILSSTMFLLIVGLETTSTLLTHCTLALSFHKQIQERLYEEVKKIAEFDESKTRPTFSYDAITSCQYLDAVISETLRILPPVLQIDRRANADYHLAKLNLDLPTGSLVNLCLRSVMNDPDYWYKPEKFDPDRFMPGNREKIVPGTYCPFGLGPRHCIGMRFSLTETKVALAKLIMKYRFEKDVKATFPPVPKITLGLLRLKRATANFVLRD